MLDFVFPGDLGEWQYNKILKRFVVSVSSSFTAKAPSLGQVGPWAN